MCEGIKKEWIGFFLKTLSEYAEIPVEEVARDVGRLRYLHLRKDEYLVHAGDIPDKMAFIVRGIFRVYYITEDGEERILVFREEGRMLSAFSAFLENTESWYNIQALEDSDLICLSFSDYQKSLSDHLCWREIAAKYVQMLFVEKEKREREFLSEDAETRYRKFILAHPGIESRVRQYHIAAYLGITPIALSRIRKKMKNI